MRRQTANLYNHIANLDYERNDNLHGLESYMKADVCRTEFMDDVLEWEWEGDSDHCVFRKADILAMATTDANMVLTQIANGQRAAYSTAIIVLHRVIETFGDSPNRGIWMYNLSIIYRLAGDLEKSLDCCMKSQAWIEEDDQSDGLLMAMYESDLTRIWQHLLTMNDSALFYTGCTQAALGLFDDAHKSFSESLKIRQNRAPGHRYTADTCHRIAAVMYGRPHQDLAGAM
jgi:tetratricopeptide (TPR) repeat protein